ncbi:Phosphinothricin N-acetyltransferase [Geitlerinema sp. FC II]|nr:GNAT family N-acetyltransferase [Geitlerinema sp. CS-897]PPT06154.1 Phosphinothricin N-acetyltransferase [Geitlerinema sp. FC II]
MTRHDRPLLSIRHARERDLNAIVAIYNAAIPGRKATADLEPVSVESRRPWFRSHVPNCYPLWVAERDRRVVAWLSVRRFYGRPAYAATAELGIYVDPDYQHQGIGSQLLDLAVREGPKLHLKTVLAFVFAHNTPSLRLFEQFGFDEWGYLPCVAELDGVLRDLVILGKRL